MIIQINSSNPNLSYILNKNPQSGLLIKSLRKGFIVGKFLNNLSYISAFVESNNEDSFKKSGEYLTCRAYCSAEAALTLLTSLFKCVKKDSLDNENNAYDTTNSLNTICIKSLDIYSKHLEQFNNDLYKISYSSINDNCDLLELNVTNNGRLTDLMRYTCLILFMQVFKEHNNYIQKDQLLFYADLISKDINIPFSVRHRFRGMVDINQVKTIIPYLNTNEINLSDLGKNERQRFGFVTKYIEYKNILDIGCGSGAYIKVTKPNNYIGVDIDNDKLIKAKSKADCLNISSSFYNDYKEALASLIEPTTVLLIEVLEHMTEDEAIELLIAVNLCSNVYQILISTPNKDFNKHFNINSNEFRYPDHLFEFTEKDFNSLTLDEYNIKWGDSYKDCPMTLYKNIFYKLDKL